jgi:hypothetical protein
VQLKQKKKEEEEKAKAVRRLWVARGLLLLHANYIVQTTNGFFHVFAAQRSFGASLPGSTRHQFHQFQFTKQARDNEWNDGLSLCQM